jgi:DNA-binding transcriptional LysR family regulator
LYPGFLYNLPELLGISGLEAAVTLVVDVMLPTSRLVDAVQAFEAKFPTVTLRLHVEALGAVAQLVLAGIASIGVGGVQHTSTPGIEQCQVGDVELIPVAAPQHPLARNPPKLPGEARRYRQLILTVRSPFTEGQDVGVLGAETWRLADLGADRGPTETGIHIMNQALDDAHGGVPLRC